MKCPKCQAEMKDNAKFCTKCGCSLAAPVEKTAVKVPVQNAQALCAKCGAPLKEGAKFCVKCGTPITSVKRSEEPKKIQPLNTIPEQNITPAQSMTPEQNMPPIQNITPKQNTALKQNTPPVQNTAPEQRVAQTQNENGKKQEKKPQKNTEKEQTAKKKGKGTMIAVIIVLILLIAAAAVGFLVWNGTIAMPIADFLETTDKEEETKEVETETETTTAAQEAEIDTEALFAEANALLAEGKSQIAVDAELVSGMEKLRDAMNQFVEKAAEAGDASLAEDQIADAYASYMSAVIKHKDMMDGQTISGSIYSQTMSELEDAEKLADELSERGYTVDTASLKSEKEAFDTSYRSRVIAAFDDFTNREAWSRTESWNLMSGFESMFDSSDLDDPLRLRYAYALSWWVQKQIETELGNKTITEKGAAIKIANMIEDMDYNPMMLQYYILYMNAAGEDCTSVSNAYDEIVQHIAQTQGLRIGPDIALEKFWYFNDFGEYSIDDYNGVTPENRQWIRNRMSTVVFAQ